MSLFYSRHYDAISKVLSSFRNKPTKKEITNDICDMFEKDNPQFQRRVFEEACDPYTSHKHRQGD